MKTAALRRKLTAWERYARRLEKLGQSRIYHAHVYYIALHVLRHPSSLVEVGKPSGLIEGYTLDFYEMDEAS